MPTADDTAGQPVDREQPDPVGDAYELPIDPDLVAEDLPAALRTAGLPWRVLAVIAAGGAVGAIARYALLSGVPTRPGQFPVGTFVINVSGSAALGVLAVVVAERFRQHHLVRPLLGTGLLGAYTTYSTFAVEAAVLTRDGHATAALGYVLASVAAGMAAVVAAVVATRRVLGVRG